MKKILVAVVASLTLASLALAAEGANTTTNVPASKMAVHKGKKHKKMHKKHNMDKAATPAAPAEPAPAAPAAPATNP